MRASTFVVLWMLVLVTVGCGRLGFELQNQLAGEGGAGGSAGAAGTDEDTGVAGRDASMSEPDASDDGSTGMPDTGVVDAATDALLTDAALSDADLADATDAAPDTCGNGTVEAPEECDDTVESATCDGNCTFAACGDGTLNAAAGEACDDPASPSTCGVSCQPLTCRAGCTCEWYRGARYMLCAEQLAKDPAQAACEAESMRLVRIESAAEQAWLRFRTLEAGFGKFHLGASDLATEGTWLWDDGIAFWQGLANGTPIGGVFSAWASGEPNSFVVGENCSEVQSIRGWNDCVCDLAKPFVCKEYHAPPSACGNGILEAGEACDDGVKTARCDADCSPAVCGDGVVNRMRGEICDDANQSDYCDNCTTFVCPAGCTCFDVNGRGFGVCPGAPTFQQADIACGRAGMTLARVYDATVDQQLRSRATLAGLGELWIGGFDIDEADRWVWTDRSVLWNGTASGTGPGYTHFTTGAPSGTANRDCLAMLTNGEWQDVDCASTRAYACERL